MSSKIENFLLDNVHLSELDPLKELSFMLDEFTKSIKQKKFSIPQLPIFIEKNSIRDSINENCCLYATQKSKKINEGECRMSVKAKKRCESD